VKPGHHKYEPKDGARDVATLYCFINVNNMEVNVYDGLGISSCEAGDGDLVVAKVLLCSSAWPWGGSGMVGVNYTGIIRTLIPRDMELAAFELTRSNQPGAGKVDGCQYTLSARITRRRVSKGY
jgi:hypothetical protein